MLRKFVRWTGIEKQIRQEERECVADEIREVSAWMYGGAGDQIRQKNPHLFTALHKVASMITKTKPIHPEWLRKHLQNQMHSNGQDT